MPTVAFLILPLILLMQAVMLPFQLKFGGEKGRLVIIASIGLIIVLGAVINTIAKIVNIEFSVVFSNLQAMRAAVTVPSFLDVPTLSSFAVKEPVTATVPCCKSTLPHFLYYR